MSEESPIDRLKSNATGVASMLVTGIWLAALFTGQSWWLGFMLFGYIVIIPLVALLFGDENDRNEWLDDWIPGQSETTSESDATDTRDGEDPLTALRRRYAEGELTDEQFERKVEALLETETIEHAADRVDRNRSTAASRSPGVDPDRETERE